MSTEVIQPGFFKKTIYLAGLDWVPEYSKSLVAATKPGKKAGVTSVFDFEKSGFTGTYAQIRDNALMPTAGIESKREALKMALDRVKEVNAKDFKAPEPGFLGKIWNSIFHSGKTPEQIASQKAYNALNKACYDHNEARANLFHAFKSGKVDKTAACLETIDSGKAARLAKRKLGSAPNGIKPKLGFWRSLKNVKGLGTVAKCLGKAAMPLLILGFPIYKTLEVTSKAGLWEGGKQAVRSIVSDIGGAAVGAVALTSLMSLICPPLAVVGTIAGSIIGVSVGDFAATQLLGESFDEKMERLNNPEQQPQQQMNPFGGGYYYANNGSSYGKYGGLI